MISARSLSADSVCAFAWENMAEQTRAALCSLGGVDQVNAILEWYELAPKAQAALRVELADLIEAGASRQRAGCCKQAERMKVAAA